MMEEKITRCISKRNSEKAGKKIYSYLNNKKDKVPLILIGDVFKCLSILPNNSINSIITSPPYYQQRDYNIEGQIGAESRVSDYVNKLSHVADYLSKVLRDDGVYFLNIGDKYGNKKNLQMIPSRVAIEMQRRGWILRNFISWYKPNHMPESVRDRFSRTWEPIFFFVQSSGTYLPPEYYFNIDDVRIQHKNKEQLPLPYTVSEEDYPKVEEKLQQMKKEYNGKFKGNEKNKGASPGARTSLNGYNYSMQRIFQPTDEEEIEIIEYLRKAREKANIPIHKIDEYMGYKHTAGHWFRKDKGGRSLPSPEDWIRLKDILGFDDMYDEKMTKCHYVLQTVRSHPKGKNPGDMWSIKTDKFSEAHFAIFPRELVDRCIKASCPPDGVVLDHFAGSGTVGEVAKRLKRKSILIDINPKYAKIMQKRAGLTKEELNSHTIYLDSQ